MLTVHQITPDYVGRYADADGRVHLRQRVGSSIVVSCIDPANDPSITQIIVVRPDESERADHIEARVQF